MEDTSGFYVYDTLTYPPLAELGWDVEAVPWNRPNVNWSEYQAVVIRSTWNYQSDPEGFLEVLEQIDLSGCKLFNPLEICRWNMEKGYLRDLQRKQVPIVPTLWPASLNEQVLSEAFRHFAVDRVVVKPTIGANADDTFVLTKDNPSEWAVPLSIFQNRPLMLQPFLESIQTVGEFSLFYFGGHYSHTILKMPKTGDFRVQEEHGGVIRAVEPFAELLRVGQQAIDQLGEKLLYARIDLVQWQDQFHLIEAELIEPSLYFGYVPDSAAMFARTLNQMTRPTAMPSRRSL